MIDLAVGMIIGSAFTSIVNSLVNDIFMPVLSIFTGKIDFSNMFIALDGNKYPTLAAANEVTATINYGSFITQAINFLLMAFVVFMVIKAINKLEKWKGFGSTKSAYRERMPILQEHDSY